MREETKNIMDAVLQTRGPLSFPTNPKNRFLHPSQGLRHRFFSPKPKPLVGSSLTITNGSFPEPHHCFPSKVKTFVQKDKNLFICKAEAAASADGFGASEVEKPKFLGIELTTLKKNVPLGMMFFCILSNYTILRDTKDVLVVTAKGSGAEIIPFLKTWVNLPMAVGFMLLYTKLANVLSKKALFYTVILPFIAFFGAFGFVLYPLSNYIHPEAFADKLLGILGPLAIMRIWSFCLFYVMAELWGSVVISVLFWGFANQITTVEEAKRFYPLFGIGANVALVFSGRTVKYFSNLRKNLGPGVDGWAISLKAMMSIVVLMGLTICFLYWWVNNYVPLPERSKKKKEKPKMGTMESLKFLVSSRYIRDLATLVVAYGISINLVEVTWKSKLKAQFPSPNEYSSFMGDFSSATGIATFTMMLLSQFIFDKYGWGVAAKITPTVLLLTGVGFFSLILFGGPLAPSLAKFGMTPLLAAVYVGAMQNIFSKGAKYSLFDPCKEMAYIPLDEDTRVKGKAAIDVVCNPLGKSGGALIQQFMILTFGSLANSTPYLGGVLLLIVLAWLSVAKSLDTQFTALRREEELEKEMERAAAVKISAVASFPKSSQIHPQTQRDPPTFPPTYTNNLKTFTFSHNSHNLHALKLTKAKKQALVSNSNSITTTTTRSTTTTNNNNPSVDVCQLCLVGNLDSAMRYLDLHVPLDEDAYIALLRLCEWKRAKKQGSKVHAHVSKSITLLSLKLGNALLSMFVRFGNLVEAWYVFGRMEERNVFSWNVLVGGYAKAGFFDEAIDLYHRMLWVGGLRPDVYTFPCVLRTCGGIPDIVRGKEVHGHVLRFGFESDVDVVNALITMYVKCGEVDTARLVFDKMPNRDRISWNAMISGYFENRECLEGLRLFCLMLELPIDPDLMTMTSVITACELLNEERLGREIHGYVMRTGFWRDPSVYNSLIQMYSSIGLIEEAEKVFARTECRDVVSWTTMISGYENSLLPHKALKTYKMMELEGIEPDEITIASALCACTCLGHLDLGMNLHEVAKQTGLTSYVIVANTLIDMYAKCKCIGKALEVFHSTREKNIISWTSIILGLRLNNRCFEALFFFKEMMLRLKPNSVTLVSVLSACARIGALTCGKEVHAHALRTGVSLDGFLPNAILDMYVKCGRMEYAWKQFSLGDPDVAAWNILLTGCAEHGKGSLAIEIFQRMVESNINPDEITFISILCACSRSGMVTEGLEFFDSMKYKYAITPNLKHYACVVDLLGRAGKLEDAYGFIKKMPMKPDPAIWGALLNACRIHHHVELGEIVAENIFQDDTKSVGYYILLSNLYADGGKWDKVAKVRKMMRQNGLIVDPGCSWVEVKGKVHAFLSGDNCHPQMKEINGLLERFHEKMKEASVGGPGSSHMDIMEASKADIFCGHSERLAIVFGLINSAPGMPIWVTKNLYMCQSCHNTVKFISKEVRREISVRDAEQFHHFKEGICSCMDEGYRCQPD